MVQPQRGDDSDASARLSRFIAEHIAKGNKPDFELARRKHDEFERAVSGLEPLEITDEQIEELIREERRRGSK